MATATKKKPPVRLTVGQQQLAEAAQIAALAIDPAKEDISRAIEAAEQRRIMLARAGEGITTALGEFTKGDAEAQRAAYAESAARLGEYGKAFTGRLRDLQTGAAAEASAGIARLGLPGAIPTGAEQNANVTLMQGATIPGETLANQAPRELAAAQARRLAGALRVADNASLMDYKAGEAIEGIRAEIAKLEAKRPGIIMESLSDIRQQANAQRATDTQIGYLQLQQAKTKQDQAIAMTNLTGTVHVVVGKGDKATVINTGKPAAGSDAAVAQVRAETSKANAAASAAARKEAARIAAAARKEAAQIAANAKAAAAKTAAGKKEVTSQKSAAAAQTAFVKNATAYARQIAGVVEKTGKPRVMPPKRVAIMQAIVNTYGAALVGKFGITKEQVEAWARAIVMAMPNAWWQPGNYKAATSGGTSGGGGAPYTAGA